MYKPSVPFSTAMVLLTPTYTKIQGVDTKTFSEALGFNASFKTYGGSESDNNGLYTVVDTAIIETWFTPLITSACRVKVCQTGAVYEILGEPENIEMRNQYLKFKVRRVKGGA